MFGSIWALPGPVHLIPRMVDSVMAQILCILQMGEKEREDVELYLLVLRQSVALSAKLRVEPREKMLQLKQ